MVTYYLNLTHANMMASTGQEEVPVWEEEYRLTEAFQVPNGSVGSMQSVLEKLSEDAGSLQQYHELNSVRYDRSPCGEGCRLDHLCAIREVDFTKYSQCVRGSSPAPALTSACLLLSGLLLGLLSLQPAW